MKFTRIPETTFQNIQLNAGIVATGFTPATGTVTGILGATTGGIQFNATPSFSDYGEDIDNCAKNMMELKKLENWEVTLSGTFVTIDATGAKKLIAAANVDPNNAGHIVPRNDVDYETDFQDIWWIGDYSDENNGENAGYCAVHLINGLNTGGFQIQSTDKGKGNFSFQFTGHYSMADQDRVPFEVFIKGSEGALVPSVEISKKYVEVTKATGDYHTIVVSALTTPDDAEVTWTSDASGTASVTPSSDTKSCTITGVDTGSTIVTATITDANEVTYSDTCTVVVTAS